MKQQGMMKYTHQHCKSFNFKVQRDGGDYAEKKAMTTSTNKCHVK